MRTLWLTIAVLLIAGAATAQEIVTVPLWADSVLIVGTAKDTTGRVNLTRLYAVRDSLISVTLWTDGIGTSGDSVDVKLEYHMLQQDQEYRTARAEATTNTYPIDEYLKASATFDTLTYAGAEWQTIFGSITTDNARTIRSISPPLCQWIQFRLTGNTDNDSTRCRLWVRFQKVD